MNGEGVILVTILSRYEGYVSTHISLHHLVKIIKPVFGKLRVGIKEYHVTLVAFQFFRGHDNVNRSALIYFIAKLIDVPVGSEEAGIDHPYIRANALYFLRIPQWISVIITKSEKYGIRCTAFKIVFR